ncbi:MAG: lysozyme inhibitor LprI family protein [Hyphomicrobium sp.]
MSNAAKLAALAFAAALPLAGPANAASFSCMADYDLNAAERMICSSRGLAALDERLDSWYRRALIRAGYFDQTEDVRDAQRAWVASRNACGASYFCLRRAYRVRIRELANYVEHV